MALGHGAATDKSLSANSPGTLISSITQPHWCCQTPHPPEWVQCFLQWNLQNLDGNASTFNYIARCMIFNMFYTSDINFVVQTNASIKYLSIKTSYCGMCSWNLSGGTFVFVQTIKKLFGSSCSLPPEIDELLLCLLRNATPILGSSLICKKLTMTSKLRCRTLRGNNDCIDYFLNYCICMLCNTFV